MPEEKTLDELVVYCMICSKPLGDDDDIHFLTGPYGFDLDVVCGQCMDRIKQQSATGEGVQAPGLGGLTDPFGSGGDWGDVGL